MNSSIAQRRDGFDQWIHQVNRICGAFSAQTLGDEFSGHIREYQSGALKLSFVDACQARLYRTPKEVAASEGGKYFAVFQLDGSACMAQGDNRVSLCAGDITLIDASQPSDFTYHENSRQLSLILPHRLIEQSLRYTPVKCGHRIGGKSPIATLSHHLILDAARQTNLSQQESEATLDAVISLLRPAISQSEGVDDVHERIFRKTLGYIDEHIRSEDLCPELLAREVGYRCAGCIGCLPARAWWLRAISKIAALTCVPNPFVSRVPNRSCRHWVTRGGFPIRATSLPRSSRALVFRLVNTASSTPETTMPPSPG